jgi:copper/silver efflux system protein
MLIGTPAGAQIPIEQVARISFSHGPAMIRDEDGQLTGYVYLDLGTSNYGGFVKDATALFDLQLRTPAGHTRTNGPATMNSRCGLNSGCSSVCRWCSS